MKRQKTVCKGMVVLIGKGKWVDGGLNGGDGNALKENKCIHE